MFTEVSHLFLFLDNSIYLTPSHLVFSRHILMLLSYSLLGLVSVLFKREIPIKMSAPCVFSVSSVSTFLI
jgi:hypothetical protein